MPKVGYAKMTDAEFYVECADAVAHMAAQLTTIARQTAGLCRSIRTQGESDKFARPILERSMQQMMECLGNLLNDLDAGEEGDDIWMDPLFNELHRRFPRDQKAPAPQQ